MYSLFCVLQVTVFGLELGTKWNLMVYIKSLKKYEHYYS